MGVQRENLTRQLVEMSGFGCGCTYAMAFMNLDLTIGPIRAMDWFHVFYSQMTYDLLLERPWIHNHMATLSTYHQCLKVIWKGRRAYINATESHYKEMRLTFQIW